MTPIQLVHRLAERIREIVKSYALEEPDSGKPLRPPAVYTQALPERMYEEDPDPQSFPFILVALGGGFLLRGQEANCAVAILAAGYEDASDPQGWMIPAELCWRILTDLTARPVMGPYKLQLPIDWTLPKEESRPLWFGNINLTWELPSPARVGDLENMDLLPPGPLPADELKT